MLCILSLVLLPGLVDANNVYDFRPLTNAALAAMGMRLQPGLLSDDNTAMAAPTPFPTPLHPVSNAPTTALYTNYPTPIATSLAPTPSFPIPKIPKVSAACLEGITKLSQDPEYIQLQEALAKQVEVCIGPSAMDCQSCVSSGGSCELSCDKSDLDLDPLKDKCSSLVDGEICSLGGSVGVTQDPQDSNVCKVTAKPAMYYCLPDGCNNDADSDELDAALKAACAQGVKAEPQLESCEIERSCGDDTTAIIIGVVVSVLVVGGIAGFCLYRKKRKARRVAANQWQPQINRNTTLEDGNGSYVPPAAFAANGAGTGAAY